MQIAEMIQRMSSLGFTEYEAKVYVSLLSEYPVTGYQAAKRAGVPRSMVYEALSRLEGRGAVLKTKEENATYYRPVPPTAILERHEEQVKKQVSALREGLTPLFDRKEDSRVWNFTGRREALEHTKDMINRAVSEIMIVVGDSDLSELAPSLHQAAVRGVKLGVMLTGEASFSVGEVIRHPKRETELHHLEDSLVVTADEGECLIAGAREDANVTVTTDANLVLITRQFIWMELFAQRIFSRLGPDLLDRLDEDDRRVLTDR